MNDYDVIVIGAGAAGLMFSGAISSQTKGLIIEANKTPGKKILISGGGRCNFTNLDVTFEHYESQNVHFSKSALKRYTHWDFIDLVANKNIPYYEKKLGQLFCKNSAKDILNLLMDKIGNNISINYSEKVVSIDKEGESFVVETTKDKYLSSNVIVASGGLPLPSIGASDIGIQIGKKFGHKVVETSPSLVPLTLKDRDLEISQSLSGVSLEVDFHVKGKVIRDDLLFTHKGISGPVTLKGSLYWNPGDKIELDFVPNESFENIINSGRKKNILNTLAMYIPKKLAEVIASEFEKEKVSELSNKERERLKKRLKGHVLIPSGTEGYRKAEVMRGGLSTDQISSKTFESKLCPGLYFIGEVIDVTGLLGGYNFQWAWSSAIAAAKCFK